MYAMLYSTYVLKTMLHHQETVSVVLKPVLIKRITSGDCLP